jgi:hypothetical protein
MKHSTKRIAAICALAAVSACGGGGGGESTTDGAATVATAEGFWSGTTSTGVGVDLVVLETGETWGVYSSGGAIVGALYGATNSSANSLSGSGNDFNIPSGTVTAGTYSGTYSPKATISVAFAGGGTFTGAYQAAYDQTASISAVAGTFTGSGVVSNSSVQRATVTISATGAVTVPASLGCSAAGTMSPRPSGKNVFNVAVTFTGSSCALGNGASVAGVAYYDAATREVLVLALNASKTDGLLYIGTK